MWPFLWLMKSEAFKWLHLMTLSDSFWIKQPWLLGTGLNSTQMAHTKVWSTQPPSLFALGLLHAALSLFEALKVAEMFEQRGFELQLTLRIRSTSNKDFNHVFACMLSLCLLQKRIRRTKCCVQTISTCGHKHMDMFGMPWYLLMQLYWWNFWSKWSRIPIRKLKPDSFWIILLPLCQLLAW